MVRAVFPPCCLTWDKKYQFNSVAQLCPMLCDPMDCSMPGYPAHHREYPLLESAQTQFHRVGDAIQLSYPLSHPSPTSIFPSIRVFSNESFLHILWPQYWSFSFSIGPSSKYPVLISFRVDWFDPFAHCHLLQWFMEKAMAPHSSTLAWKIPWMEEPGRLQSMGSLRVRHDWATSLSLATFMHWRRKWQPTPVFLPGESQGWGSLVGFRLWGRTESDTTEAT